MTKSWKQHKGQLAKWTDKQNMVYQHSGILFWHKKERMSVTCHKVKLEDIALRKMKQSQKNKSCVSLFKQGTKSGHTQRDRKENEEYQEWEGEGRYHLMGTEFQFEKMRKWTV
jgi:hypothetical protein